MNTGTLSSAGASSVSRKPGSLILSCYLLYVKLRWLMAQIYIDENFSFLFCLFASHILRKSSAVRSYCLLFVHTSLIDCICIHVCVPKHMELRDQCHVSLPNHPLLYLWRQGPLLNIYFTSTARLAGWWALGKKSACLKLSSSGIQGTYCCGRLFKMKVLRTELWPSCLCKHIAQELSYQPHLFLFNSSKWCRGS